MVVHGNKKFAVVSYVNAVYILNSSSLVFLICVTHGKLVPLSEKRYQFPVRNTK
jgi:hypothetical protein